MIYRLISFAVVVFLSVALEALEVPEINCVEEIFIQSAKVLNCVVLCVLL
jgi:hypothetical protein